MLTEKLNVIITENKLKAVPICCSRTTTITFIPCIQQRFFNNSKLLSELQNFLVYIYIKSGSRPHINTLVIHIYNIIMPKSFCHITLNFNHTFHRKSGPVTVIIM